MCARMKSCYLQSKRKLHITQAVHHQKLASSFPKGNTRVLVYFRFESSSVFTTPVLTQGYTSCIEMVFLKQFAARPEFVHKAVESELRFNAAPWWIFFRSDLFLVRKPCIARERRQRSSIAFCLSSVYCSKLSANPCNLFLSVTPLQFTVSKEPPGCLPSDCFESLSFLFSYYTVSKRSYFRLMKS